jgi:hypothetical protein
VLRPADEEAREHSASRPLTQLTLTYAPPVPVLTCRHIGVNGLICGGTTFRTFAGPTGNKYRCVVCAARADAAMCSCGHGYGAHNAYGCHGFMESGEDCECSLRGGR